jgi:malate dehydrogenase
MCRMVRFTLLFILQVRLGKNGVEEVLGLGKLSALEEGLENLKVELKSSIKKGIMFAQGN